MRLLWAFIGISVARVIGCDPFRKLTILIYFIVKYQPILSYFQTFLLRFQAWLWVSGLEHHMYDTSFSNLQCLCFDRFTIRYESAE